jgi:oligopeptide/dipeptide ABC transporter ATP-binding protein
MDASHTTIPSAASQAKGAIEIRGLSVDFPTGGDEPKRALDKIDLKVMPGEVIGLVGESGAGKTTLARSILGLPPEPGRISEGSVEFEGRDILKLPERQLRALRGKRLAMVVPNPRGELNPVLTIGDQIANMARVHMGVSKKEARELAFNMLKAVQIPDPARRMNAYPHELSGGMAQRAVMAIALICNPSFIISDDATSGLDVTVQAQILNLLGELTRQHDSAMLFITRDVGITAHFCDRVAVLYAGQIMEIAPRESLFLEPSHPYTLMLLSAFSYSPKLRGVWSLPDDGIRKAPKTGCSYAGRCPMAQDICRETRPPLTEVSPGHSTRCHFPVAHSAGSPS